MCFKENGLEYGRLSVGVLVGVLELEDGKGCAMLRGGNFGPFKSLFGFKVWRYSYSIAMP